MSWGDYDQKHNHPKRGWRPSEPASPAGKLGHILGTAEIGRLQSIDSPIAYDRSSLVGGLRIRCVSL